MRTNTEEFKDLVLRANLRNRVIRENQQIQENDQKVSEFLVGMGIPVFSFQSIGGQNAKPNTNDW